MAPSTRRQLIVRGAAAAGLAGVGVGAAGLAGVGAATNASVAQASATPPPRDDGEELQSLAGIEQLAAFAYGHLLQTGSLSAGTAGSLRTFLAHEREHVRLLSGALDRLGKPAPPAPSDVDTAGRALAKLQVPGRLQDVKSEQDALRYLIGVETLGEGAYYSAMSRLSDERLLALAAQVMSCEAQHWTALSGLLHAGDVYRAVPYPVVLG